MAGLLEINILSIYIKPYNADCKTVPMYRDRLQKFYGKEGIFRC